MCHKMENPDIVNTKFNENIDVPNVDDFTTMGVQQRIRKVFKECFDTFSRETKRYKEIKKKKFLRLLLAGVGKRERERTLHKPGYEGAAILIQKLARVRVLGCAITHESPRRMSANRWKRDERGGK